MTSLFSQQCSYAEIGLKDYSFFIDGDISRRGHVIKVKILFAGSLEDYTHEEEFIKKGEKSHCYGDGKSYECADDIIERR